MIVLWVPAAFTSVCALLALATFLESERVRVTVRLSVRSARTTPELAESLVAAECAQVLVAHGLEHRDAA